MTKVLALSLVLASQGLTPPVSQGRVVAGWSAVGAGVLLAGISGPALVVEAGLEYGGPRRAGLYLAAIGLGLGLAAIVTGVVLLVTNKPPPLVPTVWLSGQRGGVGVTLTF